MFSYGCFFLLLCKWMHIFPGPHTLGFLPKVIFLPLKPHCLPKHSTPSLEALLTWSKLTLSSSIWPFSHWKVQNKATPLIPFTLWGIVFLLMGPLAHFSHLLNDMRKINVPICFMLILGTLQSSPLKYFLSLSKCKYRLSYFPSSPCSIHVWWSPPSKEMISHQSSLHIAPPQYASQLSSYHHVKIK